MAVPSLDRRRARRVLLLAALLAWMPLASEALASVQVVGGLSRRLTLAPGEEGQGRVLVHNPGARAQLVRAYLTDYQTFADGTTRYGEPGRQARSNAPWVHLIPAEQVVGPGGSASFHFVVRVPADDTLNGTHWSMLMLEPVAPETLEPPGAAGGPARVGIRTVTRTGIHLVTHLPDPGVRDLRFAAREVEAGDGGLFLRLDLENTGESALNLTVWAELFDAEGVSLGRFDAGRRGLYPGSSARVRVPLGGVPPGSYQALLVADNGDEHVFGARYELEIPGPEPAKD